MYTRFYLLLLIWYALIIGYLSLLPFTFVPSSLTAVLNEFSRETRLVVSYRGLRELLANVALYIPLGYLLFFCRRTLHPSPLVYVRALAVVFSISLFFEVLQGFVLERYSSYLDVLANCAGGIAGVGIAELMSGCMFALSTIMLREGRIYSRLLMRNYLVLTCMAIIGYVLILLAMLGPFAQENFQLHNVAKLFVAPFSDFQKVDYYQGFSNGCEKLALFFPLGFLLATYSRGLFLSKIQRRVYWVVVIPVLVLGMCSIEFAQLFTSNRTASFSDVCFYLMGSLAGIAFHSALRLESNRLRQETRQSDLRSRLQPAYGRNAFLK